MIKDVLVKVGSVVISKAGRDSGKPFMVVEVVDAQYVHIADGVIRKLATPKKKKLKHLAATSYSLDGIGEKLNDGKKVFDAEIKSALINLKEIGDGK